VKDLDDSYRRDGIGSRHREGTLFDGLGQDGGRRQRGSNRATAAANPICATATIIRARGVITLLERAHRGRTQYPADQDQ